MIPNTASSSSSEPYSQDLLRSKTQACKKWFKNCLDIPDIYDDEWLERKSAEFNWWDSTLDVDKHGPGSLDSRLKLRPDAREVVADVLDGLEAALCKYHELANPGSKPLEEEPPSISEAEGQFFATIEAGRSSSPWSDMSDSSGNRSRPAAMDEYNGEAADYKAFWGHNLYWEQRVYIETNLAILIRIHTAIKRSGLRFRHQRADDDLKESDRYFQDQKATMTSVEKQRILESKAGEHERFRRFLAKLVLCNGYTENLIQRLSYNIDTVPGHKDDSKLLLQKKLVLVMRAYFYDPARLTVVQRRLINANVTRRNRLMYAGRAGITLSRVDEEKKPSLREKPATKSMVQSTPLTDEIEIAPAVQLQPPSSILPTKSFAAQPATELGSKFTIKGALAAPKTNKSAGTKMSARVGNMNYPKCPVKCGDFPCPFCSIMLTNEYIQKYKWRGHVAQDLCAYLCVFAQCQSPDDMFASTNEWMSHMAKFHSEVEWLCTKCAKNSARDGLTFSFAERSQLKEHILTSHEDMGVSELEVLVEAGKRSVMIQKVKCPLCKSGLVTLETPGKGEDDKDASSSFQLACPSQDVGLIQLEEDDHIATHLHEFALHSFPSPEEEAPGKSNVPPSQSSFSTRAEVTFQDLEEPREIVIHSWSDISIIFNDIKDELVRIFTMCESATKDDQEANDIKSYLETFVIAESRFQRLKETIELDDLAFILNKARVAIPRSRYASSGASSISQYEEGWNDFDRTLENLSTKLVADESAHMPVITSVAKKQLTADQYTVGLIYVKSLELEAIRVMLDERHRSVPLRLNDDNEYLLGRIGKHNVVVTGPSRGAQGKAATADITGRIKQTFRNVQMGMLVGIGGGVPHLPKDDVRLGDVVVGAPDDTPAVIQYDLGKQLDNYFVVKRTLNKAPGVLLKVVNTIGSELETAEDKATSFFHTHLQRFATKRRMRDVVYKRPALRDRLFDADFRHEPGTICASHDALHEVIRPERDPGEVRIHYSTILSGDSVMKDAKTRDELSAKFHNALCFEMEAAGLMDTFPCLVVKGICDYCDSHKSQEWQQYAAATAAAYTREILLCMAESIIVELRGGAAVIAAKLPFMVPFERNVDVVMREEIFSELERRLSVSSQHNSAALWGLGGSGKTQIALEFVYRRYESNPCPIFWVHADNDTQFLQGFKSIANLAGISPILDNQELLLAVKDWIEALNNWLLVLDNADDLSFFKKRAPSNDNSQADLNDLYCYVPKGNSGQVLWITRDRSIVGNLVGSQQGINVEMMSDLEAKNLLESLSGTKFAEINGVAVENLLSQLGNLPLAISQAAAYIQRTSIPIAEYVENLKKERKRWELPDKPGSNHQRREGVPNSVMSTWKVSMDQLRLENPLAHKILNIVAFFDTHDIPFYVIQESVKQSDVKEGRSFYDDHHEPGRGDVDDNSSNNSAGEGSQRSDTSGSERENDNEETLEATARLTDLSFLRVRNYSDGHRRYSIHNLVQEATRFMQRDDKKPKRKDDSDPSYYLVALRTLLRVFPRSDHTNWERCEMLLPHALRVSEWKEGEQDKTSLADLLMLVSNYLYDQGRSQRKEIVDLKALELRYKVLGKKHPDTIYSMASLATTYRQQGRAGEAEKIYLEVLQLRKEVLGDRHPGTIGSMADLAATYRQQGRAGEAEKICLEVLHLRKEMLGDRHPGTIGSMADLAATYRQQGRAGEAEKIYLEVLHLRKEVLGDRHPDTIDSMASLATTYRQQGRAGEAEKIYLEVLHLRKEVLGDRHPDTIDSMASLATTYRQQGRAGEAEKIYLEVLHLQKELLGDRHPDTICSMADLAATYHQQGRFSESENIKLEVLQLRREVIGDRHPDTIWSMAELAATYSQQGRAGEAEKIYLEVLQLRKEVLGDSHPDTIKSMAIVATFSNYT